MGFFDGLKKFFKAAANASASIGTVTGGEFDRYNVNFVTKDGVQKLKFTMLGREDVEIGKDDVREFSTLESGAKWTQGSGSGQKVCIGNRYKVVLNDGKAAIFNVLANYTGKVEAVFLL